jgi:hypothetical protein
LRKNASAKVDTGRHNMIEGVGDIPYTLYESIWPIYELIPRRLNDSSGMTTVIYVQLMYIFCP